MEMQQDLLVQDRTVVFIKQNISIESLLKFLFSISYVEFTNVLFKISQNFWIFPSFPVMFYFFCEDFLIPFFSTFFNIFLSLTNSHASSPCMILYFRLLFPFVSCILSFFFLVSLIVSLLVGGVVRWNGPRHRCKESNHW